MQDHRAVRPDPGLDGGWVGQRGVAATVPARRNTDTTPEPAISGIGRVGRRPLGLPCGTQSLEARADADPLLENLTADGGFAVLQRVPDAEFQPVQPQLVRQLVQQAFLRDGGLRDAKAPEGPGGRTIGVDRLRTRPVVRDPVGTRGVHGHAVRDRRSPAGIGAGVERAIEDHPTERAVLARTDPGGDLGRVTLGGRLHRLGAGVVDPHRLPGLQRRQRQIGLDREVELRAEAPAAARGNDADIGTVHGKDLGQALQIHDRRLRAGMDLHAPGLDPGEAGLGFDIGVLDKGGREGTLDDRIGIGQSGIRVATGNQPAAHDVAIAPFMQPSRVGLPCGTHGQRRWTFVPLYRECGRIEGGHGLGRADHGGGRLATEPGFFLGEDRLVGKGWDDPEPVHARNVAMGQDRGNTFGPCGPSFEITETEASAVIGRADHFDHEGIWRSDIVAEAFRTHDLVAPVQPFDCRACRALVAGRNSHVDLRGHTHGLDDLAVAGATAQYAAERIAGLHLGRVRHLPQQSQGRDHHPRRADPALRGAMGLKAPGEPGSHRVLTDQARQRLDFAPIGLMRGGQAGTDRRPVDQHGAGTTIARITPDLHVTRTETLAQRDGQTLAAMGPRLNGLPVQVEADAFQGKGPIHALPPVQLPVRSARLRLRSDTRHRREYPRSA